VERHTRTNAEQCYTPHVAGGREEAKRVLSLAPGVPDSSMGVEDHQVAALLLQ
jgi:hypothetical protein